MKKYFLLLFIAACSDNGKFTYHTKVRVTGGFYRGFTGVVIDDNCFAFNQYRIKLDDVPVGDNFNCIKESSLEILDNKNP